MTTSRSISDSTIGHVAPARRLNPLFKRILEVAAATTILLCLAPLLLITSVAIRLDSSGPVLIRETRRDCRNQAIHVFKFRLTTACGEGHCNNRRLTRVGRIIGQTGIDELPQLVNVLRAEISFIEALKPLL